MTRLNDETLLNLCRLAVRRAEQTPPKSVARSIVRELGLVITELDRRREERAETKPQPARCPHTVDLVTYIEEAGE